MLGSFTHDGTSRTKIRESKRHMVATLGMIPINRA